MEVQIRSRLYYCAEGQRVGRVITAEQNTYIPRMQISGFDSSKLMYG